jgi:hypothetical protein
MQLLKGVKALPPLPDLLGLQAAMFDGAQHGIEALTDDELCLAGVKREVSSITNRGPDRIVKKTRTFGDSAKRKPRLFCLPHYAPDRNLDERVWKHLEAGAAGRTAVTGRAFCMRKVRKPACHGPAPP